MCQPLLLFKVLSEHMEVWWSMIMALHILLANHNVVGYLLAFVIFVRTHPTHYDHVGQ